jgi:hypothetical protein
MEHSQATFRSDKVTPRIGGAATVALDRFCAQQAARVMRSLVATISHKATGQANRPASGKSHESDEPPRRNDADPQQNRNEP